MHRATLLLFLRIGLCGAAAGCGSDPEYPEYPLDGITVLVGFDEPICGGTFDVEIPEAGIYTLTMTSSVDTAVDIIACDEPLRGFSRYATQVEQSIEFVPGRKRLKIVTYIADEAVGEVVLRREPSATLATEALVSGRPEAARGDRGAPGLSMLGGSWHSRHGQIRADSGRGPF